MNEEQRRRHNLRRRRNRQLQTGIVRYARHILGDSIEADRLAAATPSQAKAWAIAHGIPTTTR